jgi:hypothetical protein
VELHHVLGLTKEYGSSWIFEPCLTWANALRRVQHPGFSLVADDNHTVALLRCTAQCDGKILDMNYVLVFPHSAGKITEA